MSGSTTIEGLPYPFTSDFADVQDAFRLASAVDAGLRADQEPLRAFMARPSFIARQTVNASTFSSGSQNMTFGAVDWDNTGGAVVGAANWVQPLAMQQSWWLFGATVLVFLSGAPVVGEGIAARLNAVSVDQVTTVAAQTNFYQRNDESNTNGEWINVFAMAPIWHGSAAVQLLLNGTTLKGIQAGTRFWGMQLGPVT
jgi:hypothetical protein